MEAVIRATVVYLFLLVVFRLAGKRALSDITTFDAVLVLIISEAVQQAMLDGDNSITNAFLVVLTIVTIDIVFSLLKLRFKALDRILDSVPTVIVRDGTLVREHLRGERVDEQDILSAARELHGLERLDQVKYAVVERGGHITVVPAEDAK